MLWRLRKLKQGLERFKRDRRGVVAVEMALVALPFFFLLFAIIELALIFLLSATLDNALGVARTIRTGELQSAGGSAASFKSSICSNLGWLGGECQSNLYVDVRTFPSFSAVNMPNPVVNGEFKPGSMTFTPGGPGSIVVVRAYYNWPFVAPLVGQALQQTKNGRMIITSTTAFRNEPYGS